MYTTMNHLSTDIENLLKPRSEGGAGLALLPIRRGTKTSYDPRTAEERAADGTSRCSWGATSSDPARWAAYITRAETAAQTEAATLALLRYRAGDDADVDIAALTAERDTLAATNPPRGSAARARLRELAAAVDRTPLSSAEQDRMAELEQLSALPPLNIAADVGLSRCLVVDADTAEEVAAWRQWAVARSGDPSWATAPLTVSSPGVQAEGGEWRHKGGGHQWFTLPEGYDLPEIVPGVVTVHEGNSHFSIFTRNRYVLLPPSQRPEGAYRFTGTAMEAPRWLLAALHEEADRREAARRRAASRRDVEDGGLSDTLQESLQSWYDSMSWSAVLEPYGWRAAGWNDSCGCPVWSRPGGASPKSATAHEPGCSQHPTSCDPPIHFWTTEPGDAIEAKLAELPSGSRSLSKLQTASAVFCDGDEAKALELATGQELRGAQYTVREVAPGMVAMVPVEPATPATTASAVAPAPAPATTATAVAPAVEPVTAPAPAPVPAATSETETTPQVENEPPQRTLAIDIETFSDVDLSKAGVYKYSESPIFSVLLFAYSYDDNPVEVVDLARGETLPEQVINDLLDPDVTKTAFNANFERACLSRFLQDLGRLPAGEFLDPAQWQCTMVHAAAAGLPRALGAVASELGVVEKMGEGKALIRQFSVPTKPKKKDDRTHSVDLGDGLVRWLPDSDLEGWATFVDYCHRDVEVERAVRDRLVTAAPVPNRLWEEYAVDQRICDRGLRIDLDLVHAAQGVDRELRDELSTELAELTGLGNPRSTAQFRDWLVEHGYEVTSVSKTTLADVAEQAREAGDDTVARACELRPMVSAASSSKYSAMQRMACGDGRARGTTQFFGAHTGRWAGRGIQTQNLARTPDCDLHAAREAMRGGLSAVRDADLDPAEIVGGLVRTAIVPAAGRKLVAADYSQIEARVLAMLAGEASAMEIFSRREDIYCATASSMYGKPVEKGGQNAELRQLGKVAVLGCGYGASWRALQAMNPALGERELRDIVHRWREANPKIVNFWSEIEAAACSVAQGAGPVLGYGLVLRSEPAVGGGPGRDLVIVLPSGRSLRYRNARVELQTSGPRQGQLALHFDSARGRESTYGGRLTENLVQAIARDLLADALVRAENAGFCTIFHVHDEIVAEVTDEAEAEALCKLMEQPPAWAEGLPLVAEGDVLDFYQK